MVSPRAEICVRNFPCATRSLSLLRYSQQALAIHRDSRVSLRHSIRHFIQYIVFQFKKLLYSFSSKRELRSFSEYYYLAPPEEPSFGPCLGLVLVLWSVLLVNLSPGALRRGVDGDHPRKGNPQVTQAPVTNQVTRLWSLETLSCGRLLPRGGTGPHTQQCRVLAPAEGQPMLRGRSGRQGGWPGRIKCTSSLRPLMVLSLACCHR